MSEARRDQPEDEKSEKRKGKRKQIGYLQLEWICPQCHARNPGDKTICLTCGMPQPEEVGFVPPLHPTILTTGTAAEAAAALVEAGADMHCRWCGVRNRATARQCTQCQGSLAGGARDRRRTGIPGSLRQAGRALYVLPNHQSQRCALLHHVRRAANNRAR
jgi:ribosomal protein L40E